MAELISSRANERVKGIRALRSRRKRDASGIFFAEGPHVLEVALAQGAGIEALVVCPGRLSLAEAELVRSLASSASERLDVTPDVYDSLGFREEGGALGAVVRQQWQPLSAVGGAKRFWLALDDIQHPGNLGTLVRTSDATGGDGVILSGASTDPYHPIAVRGSLGAVFSQSLVRAESRDLPGWIAETGSHVVGASPAGSIDFREADYASGPLLLLLGNERVGLSASQLEMCDELVRIPMKGQVESLNLAVAAAVILYEVMRQQQGGRAYCSRS